MDPKALRKRQIAKRLGVSEQVLEQYLQLKNAEVLPSTDADDAPPELPTVAEESPRQRRSTPRIADGRTSARSKRG